MEREILFRGKSIVEDDDRWYEGSLITMKNGTFVIRFEYGNETNYVPVKGDTLSQLCYRNGYGPIFEGDRVKIGSAEYFVYWNPNTNSFFLDHLTGEEDEKVSLNNAKVISNVIDSGMH